MSRLNYTMTFVLGITAIAGMFAGNACADSIYDFDGNVGSTITAGDKLLGQDMWFYAAGDDDIYAQTGDSNFSGKYAEATVNNNSLLRTNDEDWSFSLINNEDFEWSIKVLRQKGKSQIITGWTGNDSGGAIMGGGLYHGDSQLLWKFWSESSYYSITASPATDNNGIYIVGVEVEALGDGDYTHKPYYIDVTDDISTKVYQPTQSVHADDLSSLYNQLYIRLDRFGTGGTPRVDNLKITQVPEPSMLALLATGMFGLLAYAWRKRK